MSYKFLGTTDENTTCDCCGKKNLKKTIVLENEFGNIVYFGSDCASQAITGTKKSQKVILDYALAVDYAKKWYPVYKHDSKKLQLVCNRISVLYTNSWLENGKICIATNKNKDTGLTEVIRIGD